MTEGKTPSLDRGQQIIDAARTAADETEILEVGSTGICALEPLVLVTDGETTAYYPRPSVERTHELVASVESDKNDVDDAKWVVEHDSTVETLPTPSDGALAVGTRRILGKCGWVDPEIGGSDAGTATTVAREDPDAALELLSEVGVLGRGRGDASQNVPVADEVDTVREMSANPVVVVNANESDRRNESAQLLLGGSPATVLDGAFAVATIVGATPSDVIVYTNEVDDLARRRTRRAARTIASELEDKTAASRTEISQVVAGPDEYIAGEHTMALESLEGSDRLEARLRPPGPARHGLYGRPTVVHTPRTFAQIQTVLRDPDTFDATDADPGTRVFTITGDVETAATIELPTGGSMAAAHTAVDEKRRFKMACVGGQFGGFTRSLDHGVSSLALTNANLGTEGVIELFDENRCPVATVGKRVRFASNENCGRCFPCREGSKQLLGLLRKIYDGEYEDDMIRELTRVMASSSICGFGQSAARSVITAIDEFETEFRAHTDGHCPSGACEVAK